MLKALQATVLIVFCLLTYSKSQTLPSLTRNISPSPTAAALGKYGDYPVKESSGLPNISIPIYEIKLRGLDIPINLSYHASGNKIDELASWVGLGWSLNAGGVVTRTMRGLPDELVRRGFYNFVDKIQEPIYDRKDAETFRFYEQVADQYYDSEPDEYFYNFLSKSGKFVKGVGNKNILLPYDNLEIKNEFEIVDENGVHYFFNTEEKSNYEPHDAPPINYISSWYLTKIISTNTRDTIYFDYVATGYDIIDYGTENLVHSANISSQCIPPSPGQSVPSRVNMSAKRLNKIRFSGGVVVFEAEHKRTDLSGDNALTAIKVYIGQNLIKQFDLKYTYQTGRLTLESVQEKANNGESLNPFKFSYNSNSLPARGSYSQDHWGYYNGSLNSTLIPAMLWDIQWLPGANREVDPNYVQAGILRKIEYPTGGTTELEYESNSHYNTINGSDNDALIFDTVVVNKNFRYSIECTGTQSTSSKDTLTLDFKQVISYTNLVSEVSDICNAQNATRITFTSIAGKVYTLSQNGSFELDKGKYIVSGWADCEGCPGMKRSLSIMYKENSLDFKKYRYGPGLRVTRITDFDGVDPNKNTVTKYNYDFFNDVGRSSGSLSGIPKYHYPFSTLNILNQSTCNFLMRTSHGPFGLGSMSGLINYREVTKYKVDMKNQALGQTRSVYSYNRGQFVYSFPYTPIVRKDHFSGLLLNQKIFHSNGTLVKETINKYTNSIIPNSTLKGMKIGYSIKDPTKLGLESRTTFASSNYYYTSEWAFLESSTEKDFSNNAMDSVTKITTYEYNIKNLKPSVVTIKNSTSDILTTNYFYPSDFSSEYPYNLMDNEHINTAVVEERQSKNGKIISLLKTNYYSPFEGIFKPNSQLYKKGTFPSDTLLKYHEHDNKGNILVQSKDRGPKENYIWGYGGSYPIAIIENADYNIIMSVLGGKGQIEAFRDILNPTDAQINNFLAPVRSAAALKYAHVRSYSYNPMIGISAEVDQKGLPIYYEYDGFQRLKDIKDENKDIVKNFKYHHKQADVQAVYKSDSMSRVFKKECLTLGYDGSMVKYFLEMGKYSSLVSKNEANQFAINDLNVNGQANANNYGTCVALCNRTDQKMINGSCVTGIRENISSVKVGTNYRCTYRYVWHDGSASKEYSETTKYGCPII